MSWGSGANAWGPEKEDKFTKPNHWDGMLEVGDADKIKMKNKRRISSFKKRWSGCRAWCISDRFSQVSGPPFVLSR